MGRFSVRSISLGLAAPIAALVFALLVCSLILAGTGHPPIDVLDQMVKSAQRPRTLVNSINSATTYYLSAVAVAIGFRMRLFNIGVDGQYRLAAMLAAAFAGSSFLSGMPSFVRILLTLIAAMAVGAIWAGIAGFLKVTRGVSEVISTIMLNAISTAIVAYLLNADRLAVKVAGSNNIGTATITEGGRVPGFAYTGSSSKIFGLIILAALVGFLYWFMLNRTRFGFDLKATGLSESAAVASGVNVKKMVLASMLISGGIAGLVGMPQLLGSSYSYALDFPAGLGFTGIAIALLGRNHPVGMAFAAFLWGVLDQSSNVLDISGVPKEIVVIMQGIIVLSVVIAYELVRRYRLKLEQRDVGHALGTTKTAAEVSA
ncbi:ABC transporter permease [Amycolatopsis sp. NPDC059657]|uniref:ABC transporter permease n=1 Tax=Amycolatopsis sp. NPDC059657 TaxID=3346899 RepID=UPI003670581F